jgi:LPS export ABC transporter protein LptC
VKSLLYVALPAALVLAALMFTWQGLQPPDEPAAAPAEEPPRYSVTGAQWTRLGATGQPEFRAHADGIDYYADDSAKLRGITLDALGGYESPWHVEAPAGEAPARERRLRLTGGVRAFGEHQNGSPVSFLTSSLWVDLLRRELYTESKVELQTDFGTAEARGMRAPFDDARVYLQGDVQVDYAPEG